MANTLAKNKMKFRYYIIDLSDDSVTGTNKKEVVIEFSTSEDFIILDAERGAIWYIKEDVPNIKDVEDVEDPTVRD